MQGAERFANYKGYGKTLQCDGEHVDQSDVCVHTHTPHHTTHAHAHTHAHTD